MWNMLTILTTKKSLVPVKTNPIIKVIYEQKKVISYKVILTLSIFNFSLY